MNNHEDLKIIGDFIEGHGFNLKYIEPISLSPFFFTFSNTDKLSSHDHDFLVEILNNSINITKSSPRKDLNISLGDPDCFNKIEEFIGVLVDDSK